jgi:Transposase DDE domain
VPCGASRETVQRSEFAGYAAYGWCAAHSRHFRGFKLYLLCASDGMPICFELAPANAPEPEVVAAMLERVELAGYTVIGDKGLSGDEIEQLVAALGGLFMRPDRHDEAPRFGSLAGVRQWIEAIFDQLKDQLLLERHGGPHHRRPLRAHHPTTARPRRHHLAQLAALASRPARSADPQPGRLRPLIAPKIGNIDLGGEAAGRAP